MAKVLKAEGMSKCLGCFTCMNVCAGIHKSDHSINKSAIHVKTSGGLAGKFVAIVCLGCADPACAEACPSGALAKRAGGGVLLKKERCIGCGKCADACIVGAVSIDGDDKTPIICRHCGMCAKFCPHQCLIMEEASQ